MRKQIKMFRVTKRGIQVYNIQHAEFLNKYVLVYIISLRLQKKHMWGLKLCIWMW